MTAPTNADQPAFPTDVKCQVHGHHVHLGLTKRELFAAMTMQAMLASPELLQVVTSRAAIDGTAADRCARIACHWADALLKALAPP